MQSTANLNHSKKIQTSRMKIQTIWTRFEAIEGKFKQFKRDSNYSNANSSHSKNILIIRMKNFEPFEKNLKHSNGNSNHSNGIRSIRMQILTIWKEF